MACLRLLAKPKEPVLSAILGVFEVFAIARGDRVRHRRRLEKERLEKERQREMEEERELWKRRRRRQQAMEIAEEEVKKFWGVPGIFLFIESYMSLEETSEATAAAKNMRPGTEVYSRRFEFSYVKSFILWCAFGERKGKRHVPGTILS